MEKQIINLNSDKFSTFLTIMNIMQPSCENIIIKDGKVCQSVDGKHSIYDIDLSLLLGECNLIINKIASKKDILETFREQQVNVTIEIGNSTYLFKDSFSKIECLHPIEQQIFKVNVPVNDLEKTLKMDSLEPVFECCLNKMLIKRLLSCKKALDAKMLNITGTGDEVELKVEFSDQSNTTVGTITTVSGLEREFKGTVSYLLDVFVPNVDSTDLYLFYRPDNKDYVLKVSTTIGLSPEILINTWCIGKMEE